MKATRIVTIVVLSLALLLPGQIALAGGETAFQKETRAKLEKIEQDVARLKEILKKKESMSAAEKKRFDEHFVLVGTELVKVEEYLERGTGSGD